MRLSRLTSFVVILACAGSVHAAIPVIGVREVADKLVLQYDGKWGYTVDAKRDLATLLGRTVHLKTAGVEANVPQILKDTKRLHGLDFPADFDADIVRSDLGNVRQILIPQVIDGERVENAYVVVNFNESAKTLEIVIQTVPKQTVPKASRTLADARNIVRQALCTKFGITLGPPDESGIRGCSPPESIEFRVAETLSASRLLAGYGSVHRVYHLLGEVWQKKKGCSQALALEEYDISAVNGPIDAAVLRRIDRINKATGGLGRGFDSNPLMVTCRRKIDPNAVKPNDAAYSELDLPDLDPPIDGQYSPTGTYAAVVNIPNECPDALPVHQTSIENGVPHFDFLRTDDDVTSFASVMAYHHVTKLQHHTITLGFNERVLTPLRVDVLVEAGVQAVANFAEWVSPAIDASGPGHMAFSHFFPSQYPDSLVSEAEDAYIIAHEYGHALLTFDSRGRFGTAPEGLFRAGEAQMVNEGFADFWAMSAFAAEARKTHHDVRCFAPWGGAGTCLRKIGEIASSGDVNQTMDPHQAGTMWSGVLADILTNVFHHDRDAAERLILQGHLNAMNDAPAVTMASVATGIMKADDDAYMGVHRLALCRLFTKHGVAVPCCSPKGCLVFP